MAQQQQLQNLTQQLQSQLSLQNMNLNFFNQVTLNLLYSWVALPPHILSGCWIAVCTLAGCLLLLLLTDQRMYQSMLKGCFKPSFA